eukprot:TRINITY_DN18240_c0_g2_i3.p4 TRINITY_DN18240_c0_g2~~TRINITY_DN18240_c0_g2_i3.p4  ORF type:complete len:101 (+),score=20.44 TRINITY_DN18240_c0_g2_i3:1136-1438(+)
MQQHYLQPLATSLRKATPAAKRLESHLCTHSLLPLSPSCPFAKPPGPCQQRPPPCLCLESALPPSRSFARLLAEALPLAAPALHKARKERRGGSEPSAVS